MVWIEARDGKIFACFRRARRCRVLRVPSHLCVCMYVCMYACMHVCMISSLCRTEKHLHAFTVLDLKYRVLSCSESSVCMYVCMYVSVFACMYYCRTGNLCMHTYVHVPGTRTPIVLASIRSMTDDIQGNHPATDTYSLSLSLSLTHTHTHTGKPSFLT